MLKRFKQAVIAIAVIVCATACEDDHDELPSETTKQEETSGKPSETTKQEETSGKPSEDINKEDTSEKPNEEKPSDKDSATNIPYYLTQNGVIIDYTRCPIEGQDMEISAYINPENNYGVMEITGMTIEWNGDVVATITSDPFNFRKKLTEQEGSIIIISITVEYKTQKGIERKKESLRKSVGYKDGVMFSHTSNITNNLELKNGSYFNGQIDAYIGDGGIYTYDIYIDEELIHSAKSFPSKYNYQLKGLSVGTHKIYVETARWDEKGNKLSDGEKTLSKILKIIE